MSRTTPIDLNQLITDTEKAVRDGAYTLVGFGVLGFQRAQVRRHAVVKQLQTDPRLAGIGEHVAGLLKAVDQTLSPTWAQMADLGQRAGAGSQARERLTVLARAVDQRVAPARQELDKQIDALEAKLPAGARQAVGSVRAALAAPEAALREVIGLD